MAETVEGLDYKWGRVHPPFPWWRPLQKWRYGFARTLGQAEFVARSRFFDLRFVGRTRSRHIQRIAKRCSHEPQISAALLERVQLSPGDAFVDIGAHLGWYSLIFWRALRGRVPVLAVEPDPTTSEYLRRNVALNEATGVRVCACALGTETSVLPLYRHEGDNPGRNSLLPINSGERVEVPVRRLDDLWLEQGWTGLRPRFVKIDTEGYEPLVIAGGPAVLQQAQYVFMEYSPVFMQQAGIDPEPHLRQMYDWGFRPEIFAEPDGPFVNCTVEQILALRPPVQANLLWTRPQA